MMEHVGRYRESAEFLAGHGIYVLGNDHLGHGKTAAARRTGDISVTMRALSP